jgi:glucose/arabinose dehydrogenase
MTTTQVCQKIRRIFWPLLGPALLIFSPSLVHAISAPAQEIILGVPEQYRQGPFATQRVLVAAPDVRVSVFAAGLGKARFMALSQEGDIYLSVPNRGQILVLPDKNGDGVADEQIVFADGLDRPHGLAFRGRELVVAETGRLISLMDTDADLRADVKEVLSEDVPAGGGHWTRSVVVGPDMNLYISAGSSCNACIENDPRRAAMLRVSAAGGEAELYARGLRNSVGLAFHPLSGELWAVDNGRDMLGDNLPPEELNQIVQGADYGWPYCYGQRVPDPDVGSAQRCEDTRPPALEMQAHSAPLGIAFGMGLAAPKPYQELLYIAFHGSWNRSVPTGYKLVGVPFVKGKPVGPAVDIVSGWLEEGRTLGVIANKIAGLVNKSNEWGRPVAPLVGADGALYLSDDYAGAVYRITWRDEAQ